MVPTAFPRVLPAHMLQATQQGTAKGSMAHIRNANPFKLTMPSPAACTGKAEATPTLKEGLWPLHLMLQLCLVCSLPELAELGIVGGLSHLLCAGSLLVPAISLLQRQNKPWGYLFAWDTPACSKLWSKGST